MKVVSSGTIFFLFINLIPGFSNTYYVSNNGNNSNPGTLSQPWLTLQHAADSVSGGDTTFVFEGTYAGFEITTPGDSINPIVFKGLVDNIIINNASTQDNISIYGAHYTIIDNFNITNATRAGIGIIGWSNDECIGVVIKNCNIYNNTRWGIFTAYARSVLLENNETSYSGIEHGIYVSNSADYPVIRNNVSHHNNASGIQINADPALSGDGIISYALVENNICYENGNGGGSALNFASIRYSIIRNNILYKNHAGGMAFWDDGYGSGMGCKYNKIYNNTVINAADGRWALNMINSSNDNEILNNILQHESTKGGIEIDASSIQNLISDYNIMQRVSYNDTWYTLQQWQTNFNYDLNSFTANISDLFVGGSDYHLKTASPAINEGTTLTEVLQDFEGDQRPNNGFYDIGADEYTAAGTPSRPEKVKIRK